MKQVYSVLLSVCLGMTAMPLAWPQTPSPPQPNPAAQLAPAQPSQPAPNAQPAPPADAPVRPNPGLVDEIGKILSNSASGIASTFKGSRDAIQDFNSRASGAAADGLSRARDTATDGLSRIAPQTVVTGHAVCPVAANGAPDCAAASIALCKTKGYKEGKSLDVVSAEKCAASTYLSGRTGAPGECKTENFVTRAVCQ
jgi:hypothetical protein